MPSFVRLAHIATLAALLVVFFVHRTNALPHEPVEKRLVPPPQPQNDPFYTPPAGFASSKPGDVLASRRITVALFGLLPQPVEAYQLLYRTTAINGSAIATVTTVFKPLIAKKDRFVNFATAEDSNGQQCAPSYTYRLGAQQDSLIVTAENLIIQIYLAQGYIVNAPDYEGPDGAFGAARLAGTGVLDSMRAAVNFGKQLGLTTTNPAIVGVGYSGGAIATGWAASLQPTYANELNIKGWAAGGVPANLTNVLPFIDGTVWAGFLPAAIQGLIEPSSYKAQLHTLVDSIATPAGKAALAYAKTHCAVQDLGKFAFQRVLSTEFQSEGDRLLYDPLVQSVLSQQTMGVYKNETPTAPTFIYHSTPDEIIPYNDTAALVDRWCANGASVSFLTYASGGHITGELLGAVDAAMFVNNAFDGKTTTSKGCTRETRYEGALNPIALGLNLEPILNALINTLGKAGQSDKGDLNALKQGSSSS